MHLDNFSAGKVWFPCSLLDDIATNIQHQELFPQAMFPPQWLEEAIGLMQGGDHTTCSGGAMKIDNTALGSHNKGGREDGEGGRHVTP